MKNSVWYCGLGVLGLLIVGVLAVRLLSFHTYSPGVYVDEGSVGVNAYSIFQSGTDEYGVSWPVYFRAFGEFKNPLYIYLSSFSFSIFGVTVWSLRLPAALLLIAAGGVLAVSSTTYLYKNIDKKETDWIFVALSALIFWCLPWTFVFGRVAFEIAVFPVIFFVVIYAVSEIDANPQSWLWWVVLALASGLLFYSYTIARLLAPAAFGLIWMLQWKRENYLQLLCSAMIFGWLLVPVALWELQYPGALLARYHVISVEPSIVTWTAGWIAHLDPRYLFFEGDGILRHHVVGYGPLPLFTFPLIVVGVYALTQWCSRKVFIWHVLIAAISLVPAAVAEPTPHVLRSVGLLCFLSYWMSLGLAWMWHGKKFRWWVLLVSVGIIAESLMVWGVFFSANYQKQLNPWFEVYVTQSLEYVLSQGTGDVVYLSEKLYAGTYATARFMAAARSSNQPTHNVQLFSVKQFSGEPHGTELWIISADECASVNRDHIAFANEGACVVGLRR